MAILLLYVCVCVCVVLNRNGAAPADHVYTAYIPLPVWLYLFGLMDETLSSGTDSTSPDRVSSPVFSLFLFSLYSVVFNTFIFPSIFSSDFDMTQIT